MKTTRRLLLAGLLAGSASFLLAGPGPQFWARSTATKPAPVAATAATTATPTTMAGHTACATPVCPACACGKKA